MNIIFIFYFYFVGRLYMDLFLYLVQEIKLEVLAYLMKKGHLTYGWLYGLILTFSHYAAVVELDFQHNYIMDADQSSKSLE